MSLIIDLIIIIAAIAAVYLGISRGFIRSVMHFSSLILSVLAVYFFTSSFAGWIGETFIEGKISEDVEASISSIITAGEEKLKLDVIFSERPEAFTKIAEKFSFDLDELENYYNEALSGFTDSAAIEDMAEKIASPAVAAISNVIAAIIIFIVSMLALHFITFLLDMICRLPVLKTLNKFLGLLFGVGSALVTSWIIANIAMGLISALESINGDIFNETVVDSSVVLRFLANNGLIFFS